MAEIYFSTDVETDGPIPGQNSMLSLGSAAFRENGSLISTFSVNLHTLPDAVPDPSTMKWWEGQPEAWAACRENTVPAEAAMSRFHKWVIATTGKDKPVFVGYPAGFDFLFVYWYLIRFVGHSPFSFSAVDIKTYAMALLKKPYRDSTKKAFPREWFGKQPHTHKAVDDAIEQGELFMNMLKWNKNR
jgi:hypothetical protein